MSGGSFFVCNSWKKNDRLILIELSKKLNLNKVWNGKKIISWCEDLISIAIDGLDADEHIYLNSFTNEFLQNGPFSLSIQKSFSLFERKNEPTTLPLITRHLKSSPFDSSMNS